MVYRGPIAPPLCSALVYLWNRFSREVRIQDGGYYKQGQQQHIQKTHHQMRILELTLIHRYPRNRKQFRFSGYLCISVSKWTNNTKSRSGILMSWRVPCCVFRNPNEYSTQDLQDLQLDPNYTCLHKTTDNIKQHTTSCNAFCRKGC